MNPLILNLRLEYGDIKDIESDVIALKYAQDFYGADYDVAKVLGQTSSLRIPRWKLPIRAWQ